MKTLVFLCGYDDFYFRLANMTAHTIRLSGYEQDIVIFTIDERESKHATCVNLAAHPDSSLIETPKKGRFFHHRLCKEFGYSPYEQKYDFFIIKTLPGTIIAKDDYDFILYMDSDMLVHSPLDRIFAYKTVVSDYNSRSAYKDLKGLCKHLTPEEVAAASEMRGIGGGAFGVPASHFRFFDDYRANYLKFINEVPHDQATLTLTKIRMRNEYSVEQLPNRAYWIHYWGHRKAQMIADYEAKYGRVSQEPLTRRSEVPQHEPECGPITDFQ